MITSPPEHGRNEPEFTVSQLSGDLKRLVEGAFGAVRLRGEISGYRGPHSSGHAYFALKDDKARIEAVIWRGSFAKLRIKPEEGMEVVVTGKLTTYPGSSKYQIVIEALEPAGIGALMALIEERRQQLDREGLFDHDRKRPLPFMPRTIGVITSPTGAVIRDILHRIKERFPLCVLLWPVRVQGETTASEAIAAIKGFNALSEDGSSLVPRPDVLILARGGGSLEDLWGFNDADLVRTIAASTIPIIAAIGHETDWTLADLAADMRAPTPTAAAEMAVPVRAELAADLAAYGARLAVSYNRLRDERRQILASLSRTLPSLDQLLALPRRHFDELERRSIQALGHTFEKKRTAFDGQAKRLSPAPMRQQWRHLHERLKERGGRSGRAVSILIEKKQQNFTSLKRLLATVNYKNILSRGFVLVLDKAGHPVKQAQNITNEEKLLLRFSDGDISAIAQGGTRHAPLARNKSAVAHKDKTQGSLF